MSCQIDALRKCKREEVLLRALNELPATLDETYERILNNIPDQNFEEACAALQWLICSVRPMTIEEVAEAATLKPDCCSLDPIQRFRTPNDILEVCGSLVTTAPKTYRGPAELKFAHYSVKEYLLSPRIREGPASKFSDRISKPNLFVAQTSLSYLLLFNKPDSLRPDLYSPLLNYVAGYWNHHAHNSNSMGELMGLLQRLFDEKDDDASFLNWLKMSDPDDFGAKNLSKQRSQTASTLYYASLLGFVEVARSLLETSASVNAQGGRYGTALQAASSEGHLDIVKLLLDHNADVNAQGG